ncbi:MAG: response regulator [Phototrophicaceae bacterium]
MARALIVEDDEALQRLYERVLTLNGYDTHCAGDGHIAIDYLEHSPSPNLIILDIRMPNCNGYEVLKYLQNYPNIDAVHVVIATATTDFSSYCDMLPSTDFLLKPILPTHLQSIARTINR